MTIRFPENSPGSPDLRATVVADGPGYVLKQAKDSDVKHLVLDGWTPDVERVLAEANIAKLVIHSTWASPPEMLGNLARYAGQIRELAIDAGVPLTRHSAAFISKLVNLEDLAVTGPIEAVDFTALLSLRRAFVRSTGSLGSLPDAPALENLVLEMPVKDLTWLSRLRAIRRLDLGVGRSLSSLEGLAESALEELHVMGAPKLTSIAPLARSRIERLYLDGVKSIIDFERIADARMLRVLHVEMGTPIPSLDFVANMSVLRDLRIGNTAIGGNEPCSLEPIARQSRLHRLYLIGRTKPLRNLVDADRLGALHDLTAFGLDKGPKTVSSIEFVRGWPKLQSFNLHGSVIADGGLAPLLALPQLEHVRIDPSSARYSHTQEQFVAAMLAR